MRAGVGLLSSLLFPAGIAVGIVLTGQLRTQTDGVAASAVLPQSTQPSPTRDQSPPRLSQTPRASPNPTNNAVLPSFADVAEKSIQTVANISSRQVVRQRSPFPDDRFFRYFFGDARGFSGYRERPSLGSGVIVRSDGYIVTNAHVV